MDEQDRELETLIAFVRDERGFDFSDYKRSSLARRIRKRMEAQRIESFGEYQLWLEERPAEFGELFNTILINVTSFFRDPEAWEALAADVLPAILASRGSTEPVRAWVAGCATGEEAYTVAMLLCEALGE